MPQVIREGRDQAKRCRRPPSSLRFFLVSPGTSKWNKIEHRMVSFISMHWKGQPLVSFETVINPISATTTRSGLNLQAVLDERDYETGQSISDEAMQQLCLRKHEQDPQWNYTLSPRPKVRSQK